MDPILAVSQTLGAAAIISSAQAAFVNRLISVVSVAAPGVNPAAVIATGATQIRDMFPADQVPGIILGYMAGIKVVFALVAGATGISFIVSLFSSWKKLDPKALEAAGGAA